MRPIPGTVTDPHALSRALAEAARRDERRGYIVTDADGTIYAQSGDKGAAEDEATGLRHQGVECWVVPVDDLEVE